jgi:hypothetical protein
MLLSLSSASSNRRDPSSQPLFFPTILWLKVVHITNLSKFTNPRTPTHTFNFTTSLVPVTSCCLQKAICLPLLILSFLDLQADVPTAINYSSCIWNLKTYKLTFLLFDKSNFLPVLFKKIILVFILPAVFR